jgi:hypothetical protein
VKIIAKAEYRLILVLVLVVSYGCSAMGARQRFQELVVMQQYKFQAWNSALLLSGEYCKTNPNECRPRLIKLSADVSREDDWYRINMPPYSKILELYETGLRKSAPELLPMDERLTEELKVMASFADIGVLSDEEGRRLATSAMRNFRQNLLMEAQGLAYEYQVALQSDSQMHQAIAVGLAAGVISAAASRSYTPPQSLQSPGIQTFTITNFRTGRMYTCTSTPSQISCF